MPDIVIHDVAVLPGAGRPVIDVATVVIDAEGVVREIEPGGEPSGLVLMPAAVDLHLDNLRERRRPRATVNLDQRDVLVALDAECAAAGIAVVCIAARCEHAPGKGVVLEDAVALAATVEELAPALACDWRVHARVEVTEDAAVDTLAEVLGVSTRVALVSVMEHSIGRTRFPTAEAHRAFYAEDWGVSIEQVEELDGKGDASGASDDRRRAAAVIARTAGIPLGSHDDRNPEDVEAAAELGARVAEFPLTPEAARRARALGMTVVLGAPNAVRGRSTSPGNLLASDAVRAGLCDALCSDYLPASLVEAPHALAARGDARLDAAVDLIASGPAAAIGLAGPAIEVGRPLTATLRRRVGGAHVGVALWRDGHLVFSRPGRDSDRQVLAGA
jgi:alpha-D-ribose 1-methylphosphonate 5-triphosphate diphosphatase